jgi:hypothetical protein
MSKKRDAIKIREGKNIDCLVFKYQDGDEASGEEILRLFGGHPNEPMTNFIGKYYNMIRYVRFNFKDKDSRGFISLFAADEQLRAKLKPFFQYNETKVQTVLLVERLKWICSSISDDELKQELRFILLKMAKRYVKESKRTFFTAYLKSSYKFYLCRYINKATNVNEPYLCRTKPLVYMQDDNHYSYDTLIKLDERAFITTPILEFDDELGNSWIRGITCSEEFLPLTALQRLILKLGLYDEKSDRQIAEKTRLHINTINRQKLKAVKIVKEERERLLNRNDD